MWLQLHFYAFALLCLLQVLLHKAPLLALQACRQSCGLESTYIHTEEKEHFIQYIHTQRKEPRNIFFSLCIARNLSAHRERKRWPGFQHVIDLSRRRNMIQNVDTCAKCCLYITDYTGIILRLTKWIILSVSRNDVLFLTKVPVAHAALNFLCCDHQFTTC